MQEVNLPFVSAYWCHCVSADYEKKRFVWSWDVVEEAMWEIGDSARSILLVLAKSAPDEFTASYLAAGPLEDYTNLIVQRKNADEAAFITSNSNLFRLLPLVWGKVEELGPLAKNSHKQVKFQEPHPEKNLKTLEIRELMGFWCRVCGSSTMEQYEVSYNQVLKKLLNKKSRESAINDITVSAPEKSLLEYVKTNVFVLQD